MVQQSLQLGFCFFLSYCQWANCHVSVTIACKQQENKFFWCFTVLLRKSVTTGLVSREAGWCCPAGCCPRGQWSLSESIFSEKFCIRASSWTFWCPICLCSSNGCNYAWVVVYPKKKDSVLGSKDCPGSCHIIFKVKNDRQTLAIDNIRSGSYEPCQWSLNFGSQATAFKIGKSHSFAYDGLFGGGMGWRGLGGSAVITARLLFLPELLSMSKLPCFSHNCLQAAGK